jgi:hypothetical protein
MALDKLVDSTQLDSDLTSVANAIRAKSGGSSQLAFPAGFVSEIQAIPSGGGGVQTVASGTFTGSGADSVYIPVGAKMPKTDFIINIWLENGTEIEYSSQYVQVIVQILAQKKFVMYDLSSDGQKANIGQCTYASNNSGTITNRTAPGLSTHQYEIRNGAISVGGTMGNSSYQKVIRAATGFTVYVAKSNVLFKSGYSYKWEILYFGSDAGNDIVEVA